MESWLGGWTVRWDGWELVDKREHEKEQWDFWHMGKVVVSPYTCVSAPAEHGRWGAECLLEWFQGGLQITNCHVQVRGLPSSPPGGEPEFGASASLPILSSLSPAWICYTPSKWIYGPINGESLCIIKSRTDLTGIQFNNYSGNSIIFRYVVSVSADPEDLLGALDRQNFSLLCC